MDYEKLENKLKNDSCVYPLPEDHVFRTVSHDSEIVHIGDNSESGISYENLCGKEGRYTRELQRSTDRDEICGDCIRIAGYFEKEDVTGLTVRYIESLDKVKIEERSDQGELIWYQYLDASKASKLGRKLIDNPMEF